MDKLKSKVCFVGVDPTLLVRLGSPDRLRPSDILVVPKRTTTTTRFLIYINLNVLYLLKFGWCKSIILNVQQQMLPQLPTTHRLVVFNSFVTLNPFIHDSTGEKFNAQTAFRADIWHELTVKRPIVGWVQSGFFSSPNLSLQSHITIKSAQRP